MNHLDSNHILTDNQHGFRRRRSCESQLLITTSDIAEALNNRKQIDMAVLDFAKAFDKVPHQRLLAKLHHYGIRGSNLQWIKAFLDQRTQAVVVDGTMSDYAPVSSGVPQGSVLGPVLFLLFVNDIGDNVTSRIRLFADDCVTYRIIESHADVCTLQNDLNTLSAWAEKWQMSFNVKKCVMMRITNARSNIIHGDYQMKGEKLDWDDCVTYLGIKLNSHLTWSTHIKHITAKARRNLAFIRRNLHQSPKFIRERAYLSVIRPSIEYASCIWDPHTKTDKDHLDKVQRSAARFVLNKPHRRQATDFDSVTNMVTHLKWPSLERRRKLSTLTMLYKMRNNLVEIPTAYHPETKVIRKETRSTLYNSAQFVTKRSIVDSHKYSFLQRASGLWNALPNSAVSADSLEAFKSSISESVL